MIQGDFKSKIYSEREDIIAFFSLSQREEKINNFSENLPTVFPNPFKEETTVSFYNPANGNVKLSIYNLAGVLIYEESVQMEKGNQFWNIDLPTSKNTYYYKLQINDRLHSGKLIQLN